MLRWGAQIVGLFGDQMGEDPGTPGKPGHLPPLPLGVSVRVAPAKEPVNATLIPATQLELPNTLLNLSQRGHVARLARRHSLCRNNKSRQSDHLPAIFSPLLGSQFLSPQALGSILCSYSFIENSIILRQSSVDSTVPIRAQLFLFSNIPSDTHFLAIPQLPAPPPPPSHSHQLQ